MGGEGTGAPKEVMHLTFVVTNLVLSISRFFVQFFKPDTNEALISFLFELCHTIGRIEKEAVGSSNRFVDFFFIHPGVINTAMNGAVGIPKW